MLYAAVLPLIALMFAAGPALAQARQPATEIVVDVEQQAEAERLRACPSGRWRWRGNEFATPATRAAKELDVPGGRLIGIDRGEFGGELRFRSLAGQESVLSYDNVVGLMPAKDGAIVLFGVAHRSSRGYVMRARQTDGVWSLTFVGNLPGKPDTVRPLGDLYGTFRPDFAVATRASMGVRRDIRAKPSVVIVGEFSAREQAECIGQSQRRKLR
jgi:hypothetical protein